MFHRCFVVPFVHFSSIVVLLFQLSCSIVVLLFHLLLFVVVVVVPFLHQPSLLFFLAAKGQHGRPPAICGRQLMAAAAIVATAAGRYLFLTRSGLKETVTRAYSIEREGRSRILASTGEAPRSLLASSAITPPPP